MRRSFDFVILLSCIFVIVATTFLAGCLCLSLSSNNLTTLQNIKLNTSAYSHDIAAYNNLQKIATFSTSFVTSNDSRSFNIALACDNFNWLTINAQQDLSFNTIVGKRIEERGYRTAKVIVDGEYTLGVGGGVCQVSSTLYNAWIRAGLGVKYVKAHTIPTSYCELGQDATVSDYIDLILTNDTNNPIVINATTNNKIITFDIYGVATTKKIDIYSQLIRVINPPEPIISYVDSLDGYSNVVEDGNSAYTIISQARVGYEVDVYNKIYDNNYLVENKKIRREIYHPSPAKILILQH